MIVEPDLCTVCGTALVVDHYGPDGSEYTLCPKCDADLEFGACGHPLLPQADGTKICLQCYAAEIRRKEMPSIPVPVECGNFLDGVVEQQSDLGIEMRDCAFLWDIGIRADEDLLRCLVLTRKLLEA